MLKCVAVLVLICQLLTASALSASILSLDLDTDANVHIHSVYLCGLSAPVSLNSQPVSYTILSFNVDEVNGNTTYAFYNDQSQFMAAFGPAGMSLVSMIKNTQDRAVAPMPLFSPLSQDQFFLPDSLSTAGMFNRYTSYVYWILPSGTVEAVALVFILSQRPLFPNRQMALTFPTQGVNYISGSMLPIVTATLGARFFVLQKIPQQRYTLASYASAFGTAPGIVYQLLESDRNYPTEWIEEMISDTHLIKANTTIGTTFTFDYVTLQAYNRKAVAGAVLPPQNMITAYPVPGVGALDFQATQDFLLQATDSISSVSTNSERNFMMAGWVGGWALMQALNMYTGTKYMAKKVFHDNLANAQSMFLVSDLFYGSMGAPCSAIAKAQGGICECRWAGNSVWFSKLARTGSSYDSEPLRGGMFQYAMNTCANVALYGEVNRAKFALPQTIHVVGVSPRDNEMMSSICGQTNDAIETVSNSTLYWHHSRHAYTGYCIPSSMDSVSSDLNRHNNTYVTTSLMGVVPDAVATSDSLTRTLILDFMAQTTQPRVARANFVYLFPTLEQELYVLAAYLSNVVMDVSVVCAVVRNSRYSSSTLSLVMTTLKTFDIVPFSSNVVIATGDLASGIPSSCTHTFVIGTADGDAAALEAYLKAEANALVLMSFDDVTKFYASLGSAFKSSSSTVTNRLVFATNLPSWTGSSMSSNALNAASALSRVGEYVGTLAPAVQTPAAVRAFIVAMVYDRLTMGSNWGLPDIEGALYNQETLFVGGMTFGPFRKSWSGTQGVINYGARDISVWSFTRAVNRSAAVLMPPMNPSLVYVPSATSSNVRPNISLKHENCVSMQESSSYMTPASSTTIDLKIGATRITTAPTTAVAGSDSTSIPSDDTTLRDVLGALVTALVLIGVYIIVLLLFHFRVPQCAWVYVQSVPLCWRWRDRYARGPGYVRAANKIRDAVVKQNSEDCVLGFKLQTMCPTADTEPSQLTTICIHVEQWRPLWVRHPRATSHAVRHFQRCLRRTAVKHKVYVMRSVEGMVVLLSPSADVGLSFARELVDEVAKDNTKDSGAVTEEYGHFGCGQIGVRGLRMRVAVHSGPATRRADACGRALFTGPSIDGAVGAACAAGTAGLVVVTASAIKSMGTKADKWRLKSMGNNPLVQAFVDDALYTLTVIQSEAACPHGTRCVADVCNALHLLTVSCEQTKEGMVPWCMRLLVAHYTNMSENERVSDLRFLAGLFILTPALSANDDSTRAEYMLLLRCVSEHLASVMECRHGYSRSVIQRPQTREGVGSTSVTFIEEENRELFGLTEHNHRPTALRRRSCTFRRQTLRVFAYDIDEDAA